MNKLTDSEDEAQSLAVNPVVAATRSGKEFAKEHDRMAIYPPEANGHIPPEAVQTPPGDLAGMSKQCGPPAPLPSPSKPTKAADKRPEMHLSKPLDRANKVTKPIRFDIVKQLDQISARVFLHELLRLSPATRKALREALADTEVFMT